MNFRKTFSLTLVVFFALVISARADMKQIKAYKEAFPSESPKCTACHVDSIPKKDDGKHELNEYGQKVVKECAAPTAETYKKVGKAEEVKK